LGNKWYLGTINYIQLRISLNPLTLWVSSVSL
jgi:hypothetical protein